MKTKREILKFQDIKRVCDNLKKGYLATTQEEKISVLKEIDNILKTCSLSKGAFIDISNLYDFNNRFKTRVIYGVVEDLKKMGYEIIYDQRKKIEDLTLKEVKEICEKQKSCDHCPLFFKTFRIWRCITDQILRYTGDRYMKKVIDL